MIAFKPITPSDRKIIEPFYEGFSAEIKPCDFSFDALIVFQTTFGSEFAIENDCLFLRATNPSPQYLFPLGDPDKIPAALDSLFAFEENPFFARLIQPQADILSKLHPDYVINLDPSSCDYVYETEKLITLSGKKLHSKKNHYNAFIRENPNFEYRAIDPSLANRCAEIYPFWFEKHPSKEQPSYIHERDSILHIFQNWEQYELNGGAILSEGVPIAFTISELLAPDVAHILIEKAAPNIRGAFTAINKLHLEHTYANIKYVNREEDFGLKNLRKAKLSYHPCFMIEKFSAGNKPALRKWILAERAEANQSFAPMGLTEHPQYISAKTVFCYETLPGEVDTSHFIEKAISDGKQVFVPEVDKKNHTMSLKPLGNYPTPQHIDLTIVPALAFNNQGYRLGFGGGHYDRFLSQNDTYSIGIIQENFLLDHLPTESHDQSVNEVLTA